MAPAQRRQNGDLDDNDDDDDLNNDDIDDDFGTQDGQSGGDDNAGGGGDGSLPADVKVASPTLPSSQPPVALPAATDQPAEIGTSSSGGGLPTGVKIFLGVAGGLIGLGLIFALTIFLLKRKWRKEALNPGRGDIIYEAPDYRGSDDEGGQAARWADRPSEESAFKDGASSVTLTQNGGHSRKSSQASQTDYLKTRRNRSSLGSVHAPGVAVEEAYMLYGGSTTSVDHGGAQDSGKTHSRHSSDPASIMDSKPRRGSLLDEQSRYPSLAVSPQTNRRLLRHSVSYAGSPDPFSDSTIQPLRRTATAEAPSPTSSSPKEGKRISLRNGVGVRTQMPQSPPAVAAN